VTDVTNAVETQSRSSCDGNGAVYEGRLADDGEVAGHASAGGEDLCHRVVEGQTFGRFPSVVAGRFSDAGAHELHCLQHVHDLKLTGSCNSCIFTARRNYASTVLGVIILSVCHTRAL